MKKVIAMNGRGKQMNDSISRQEAIDLFNDGAELLRHVLDDINIVGAKRKIFEQELKLTESYISDLKELSSAQPEPIRINLNEWIKVKLTDWGKEIYYHQYDKINQIAGKEICKPKFPKEDENGYTKFQLWCFIELYGEYMGITLPNVIEPLEIVYER